MEYSPLKRASLYNIPCRMKSKSHLERLVRDNCLPYLGKLSYYIRNDYLNDIFRAYTSSLNLVRKYLEDTSVYHRLRPAILIDLDETFLQSPTIAPYNLTIHPPDIQKLYAKLAKEESIGPIMPFMGILYKYLIKKGIKVIFMTERSKSDRGNIKYNLSD